MLKADVRTGSRLPVLPPRSWAAVYRVDTPSILKSTLSSKGAPSARLATATRLPCPTARDRWIHSAASLIAPDNGDNVWNWFMALLLPWERREAGLHKWPFVAGTESSSNCSSNVSDVLVRNNKFMCYRGPEVTVVKSKMRDLPGGPVVKNLPANARDMGSIPGQGRFHMSQSN